MLFIVQLVLIIIAAACFLLWVLSLSADRDSEVIIVGGEQVLASSSLAAFISFGVFAACLWLLFQTRFDLCSFLRFWWPGMPTDVFGWSCIVLPKMQ